MGFLNPVSLNKQFEVRASAGSIDSYISRNQPYGFSVQKIKNYEYIFLSDLSLGTLGKNSKESIPRGIQTTVKITNINKSLAIVTFKAKLRAEIIIALVAVIVFAALHFVNKDAIPKWIPAIFFPSLLIFLFVVYRIQEHTLQSKAERYLMHCNANPTKNN